jgi:hypothetical protein
MKKNKKFRFLIDLFSEEFNVTRFWNDNANKTIQLIKSGSVQGFFYRNGRIIRVKR